MIICCPACSTRYVVPDSAIGVEGRTVRCAKCKHSWFQDGHEVELPPRPAAAPQPAPRAAADPPPQPAPAPTPAPTPAPPPPPPPAEQEPEPEAFEEPAAEPDLPDPAPEPPEPDLGDQLPPAAEPVAVYEDEADDYSQFDPEPPFRPRRNPMRIWTWAAAIFAILALGTVGAASYWGLPDWLPISRPTFGLASQDLVLDFPADKQDRRELPNGTEFFEANGTITNVGTQTRTVPPIKVALRDEADRIVYEFQITPPQRTLAPGESVTIAQAESDVPRAARSAEFGWQPN